MGTAVQHGAWSMYVCWSSSRVAGAMVAAVSAAAMMPLLMAVTRTGSTAVLPA